jgi:uncharacterized membrane protein
LKKSLQASLGSISPATQSANSGAALTYTVTVTNRDSTACASSIFNLQKLIPSGWSASFAVPSLTLNPGASASSALIVTSPVGALIGNYSLNISAVNSSNANATASASAIYSIIAGTAGLSVTASADSSVYNRGKTARLTTTVKLDGATVAGASVLITVTKPTGATVTLSATTNTSGVATANYRISRKDPVGLYQVKVNATSQARFGSASTSFTVQ